MAREPSTQNTVNRMSRDMAQQEAMPLPRQRLATTNRISLTRAKMAQHDISVTKAPPPPAQRGIANDPLNLIDNSFETMPRRTVQLNEIMATQNPRESNINNMNNINRKRLVLDDDDDNVPAKEPKMQDSKDANDLNNAPSSWDERQYKQELREAQELIHLYKDHLIEKTLQYEELLHARTTEQEEALENFAEWRQPTEEGYLALRDQVEEFLKDKDIAPLLENNHHQEQQQQLQDNTAELRAMIDQLQSENADLKEKAKAALDEPPPLLNFYETLTGVVVREVKKKDGTAYKCVITGKNGTFQFALSIGPGKKNGYVFYSPSLRDTRLLSTFPRFLKEEIEFEREYLPTFLSRITQLLN